MYKTRSETEDFLQDFLPHLDETPADRDIILCVPFTDLSVMSRNLHGSRVRLGAQNVHWAAEGAYTGEISAEMLVELSVRYVIVGHSERRLYFGETDETVNLRLKAAQTVGMTPILCVGETKQQRDAGQTEAVILDQLRKDLVGIDQGDLIIAYEPIWAIGTGDTCEATDANQVIGAIRKELNNADVSIQYGGSVKPENIAEVMAQPEIDGALVGGASLDPKSFGQIVAY